MKIEIDQEGYPTAASVDELKRWTFDPEKSYLAEAAHVLDAVADYFNECGYGRARRRGNVWRFATGGWSGCEEVIDALPSLIDALAWRSSHRGGLHWYALEGVEP